MAESLRHRAMPLLHLLVGSFQFSFAGLMSRDLCRTGTTQTVLGEMFFNLPAARTRCFQILFAIALDFRLAALAALDFIAKLFEPGSQLRAINRSGVLLRSVKLLRLERVCFSVLRY